MTERSIFAAALDITNPADRAAYLDRACAGDAGLRRHVEELLAAQSGLGSFLERPAAVSNRTATYEPLAEGPGSRVGPYKLLQEIGEGGMGTVFMAEQEEPVRRMVAVKIIRAGMDSKGVLARFEAERQALALMDHPNIAKVLDAGTTAGGSPYFVMELVKGVPITKFSDENQLSLRERLELFIPVCQAIQHAHMKGIIHRDVKPSNVLVAMYDDKPVPKVIDFGVAKATSQKLTDKTMFTAFGAVVGTLEYMSPEQAKLNQLDIDTRSDVYALGVLLYELLTGSTPLDRARLRSAALDEVLRLIREEEPPKPSTRLSTAATLPQIAAARGSAGAQLGKVLRGELDWIVMKALEKDRTRRYDGAANLAKDLQRYLSGDAVEACPPTLGYRLWKAYRRNRGSVLVGSVIAAVMLLATAVSLAFGVLATRSEVVAERERASADRARVEAIAQRDAAESARDRLRQSLYASDLQAANTAWQTYDALQVRDLLDRQQPAQGEADLRGFEWHFLNRQCRSEVRSLRVKPGMGALNPDGSRLWVATPKGVQDRTKSTFREWDLRTGREMAEFIPFADINDDRLHCKFSGDGKRVVVSGWPRGGSARVRLKVYETDSRRELFDETIPTSGAMAQIETDASGRRLVVKATSVGDKSHTVTIWDVVTHEQIQRLVFKTRVLTLSGSSLAVRPDGERFAIRLEAEQPEKESDNDLQVWDVKSGTMVATYSLGSESISGLRYSPDGKTLAYSLYSRDSVILREADTGRLLAELVEVSGTSRRDQVRFITFSPDGSWLTCHTFQQTQLRLWRVPTGNSALARSPRQVHPLPDSPRSVAFSSDNRFVTVSCLDGSVSTWAVTEQEASAQTAPPGGKRGNIVSAVGSPRFAAGWDVPDGKRKQLEVRVWDETGRVHFTHREEGVPDGNGNSHYLRLSPDGSRLAHAVSHWGYDAKTSARILSYTRLQVWDVATGKTLFTRESDRGEFVPFAFTPDGKRLAAAKTMTTLNGANDTSRLVVWNLDEDTEAFAHEVGGMARKASVGPGGMHAAWTVRTSTPLVRDAVVMWDIANGKELWRLDDIPFGIEAPPVFSPDGRVVAVMTSPRTVATTAEIRLLNSADGTPAGPTLMSRRGSVVQFQFSPEGRRLFGYDYFRGGESGESRAIVWDVANGRELLNTPCPVAQCFSLSPDGRRVYWLCRMDGSQDVQITTWDGTPLLEPKP